MARITGLGKSGEETSGNKVISKPGNKKVSSKQQNFQAQFSKAHKQEVSQELEQLMGDIKEKGDRLADQMNWESFISYRDSVKSFLRVLIGETYQVASSKGKNRFGSQKLYRHVETIDNKLAELGKQLVEDESEKVDVIAKIDEIRGLLLDLYQ